MALAVPFLDSFEPGEIRALRPVWGLGLTYSRFRVQ